jgi:hypothetical protein
MIIWSISRPFGIFYRRLVCFPPFWYIFTRFGMFYQENLATLHPARHEFHLLEAANLRLVLTIFLWALAVWRSGHCICLRNKKTRIRTPPGYKVFSESLAVLLCKK